MSALLPFFLLSVPPILAVLDALRIRNSKSAMTSKRPDPSVPQR